MPPKIFVSYSHQDEGWKERVVGHLQILELEDVLEVWEDRRIAAGDDWRTEIEAALDGAAVALLLISRPFLTSRFVRGTEIPRLLERRKAEGVRVIPIFVHPCPWQAVPWLAAIEGRPKNGQALSKLRKAQAEQHLADLALEIRDLLRPEAAPSPAVAPTTPAATEGTGRGVPGRGVPPPWEGEGRIRGEARRGAVRTGRDPDAPIHLDLGRLPTSGPLFVGREAELAHLDAAWESPATHVLIFVAFGGVGKSTLAARWLDRMAADGWRGARRVLDWSFYSQGTEERVTSADRFLDHALGFFGDPDPTKGAPRDRGLRLAELIRREKTLLVLDGVEPLQHPPGPLAGRLKDPGLAALLKSLAGGNPGLCVVTTRERIADLENFPKTAPQVDLETLSPEAGAELLRQLGVKGKDSDLLAASVEFGGHALALSLLGTYLRDVCNGDVRRRKEVPLLDEGADEDGHARRVLTSYAAWLQEPELEVLRLLGFFDRVAAPDLIAALRAEPAISGLTEHIGPQEEARFQKAVSRLRKARLLEEAEKPGALDAHPLVRVYFQEELEREQPLAWQEGNLRLYVHLKEAAPDLPETLEAMEPLFTAVIHGCRAERQQEAYYEVYRRRIQRVAEFYSLKKLGAFGSDLAALAGFFDRPWDQPSARLPAAAQANILNIAAYELRALGRLAEASQPIQTALEKYSALNDWKNAAQVASNLSELTLTLGEVVPAVSFGEQSVALADRSGDAFQRMGSRTTLAGALHQADRWEESGEAFREAEAMQAERQPGYPRLYSQQGYIYCNLLLSLAEPEDGAGLDGLAAAPEEAQRFRQGYREVQERAEEALGIVLQGSKRPLDIALNHLSLGRAHLGLALTAPVPATPGEKVEADFAQAAGHLDRAVEGLRQAGDEEYVARGLLARSTLHRLRANRAAAAADLSEALEIADRGGMRIFACDAHLEWARLELQRGDTAAAGKHVAAARNLVDETGYRRREREVVWLEERVGRTSARR